MIDSDNNAATTRTDPRVRRIEELQPLLRAWSLSSCQLYWIPINGQPAPYLQRQWLVEFVRRFHAIAEKREVTAQCFLQMKAIQPHLRDEFIRSSNYLAPMIGLTRRPHTNLPAVPDKAFADDLAKGKVKYDHAALQPDYGYWFTAGEPDEVLSRFVGYGGISVLYLPPDPDTKPPKVNIPERAKKNAALAPLLEKDNLAHINRAAFALKSKFLKQSKEMFGADLKEDPQYPGLLFILPLLASADFFESEEREMDAWFQLFDFYLQESPKDGGMILATRHDIEDELVELIRGMREEKWLYPES